MKVTQAMIDLFGETLERVPRREIEEGIQAVLDLITVDPAHQVYYRSLTPDGNVWCESSSASDFPNVPPKGLTLIYQKIEIDTMSAGWQEWTP